MHKEYVQLEGIVEIMGHKIDLSKIKNPLLIQVIRGRIMRHEFLFGYNEHTDHTESSSYNDHSYKDHRYEDYADHSERYSEYSDYTVDWNDFVE